MKFNIYFLLRGPAGMIEAPNKYNPVEADDLKDVLIRLSQEVLDSGIVEILGARVEKHE